MPSKYGYCPQCGSPLNNENSNRPTCTQCNFVFYQNSSPTASAIILNDKDEVLLSKRAIEPYHGFWDCIGGFLENGEDPLAGLKREVKEEIGIEVEIIRLIDIVIDTYGKDGNYTLNIYYYVKALSQEFNPQDDISEVRWFSLESLPENLAFANNRKILEYVAGQVKSGRLIA